MNVDGQSRQDAGTIQIALSQQMDHSVEWVKTIEAMKTAGCTTFVECGSGRVLSGLLRRIDKQLQSYSTETPEAIEEARQALETTARKGIASMRFKRPSRHRHLQRSPRRGKSISHTFASEARQIGAFETSMKPRFKPRPPKLARKKTSKRWASKGTFHSSRTAKSSSMRRLTRLVELICSINNAEITRE